jgi:DNA-binding CsgD family transcriptional regulator
MSLQLPVLDDTDFEQLLTMALQYIAEKRKGEWTAASEGDPGRMLIEVFAYLTDQTIYRLNRLPRKVYIAFLRLLGHSIYPPMAAEAILEFTPQESALAQISQAEVHIPRGTRVTTETTRGEDIAPVFVTLEPLRFPLERVDTKGTKPSVRARHCTWVRVEELGTGTGLPDQVLQVAHPPIVAPFGLQPGTPDRASSQFDVRVWVETDPAQGGQPHLDRPADPRFYAEWREVARFGESDQPRPVYTVERLSGTIRFSPKVRLEKELPDGRRVLDGQSSWLDAVPGDGKQILVSYTYGGGATGNVLPGTLKLVQDPIDLIVQQPDRTTSTTPRAADELVTVTNPKRADGGQDAETLENALLRGPLSLYSREQVVTARDYERFILRDAAAVGGANIARARALTKCARWAYAEPGTVEIQLLPAMADGQTPTPERLHQRANEIDLTPIEAALAERVAMGTRYELRWACYKEVRVNTSLLIDYEVESPALVEDAVRRRLAQFINPFHDPALLLPPAPTPSKDRATALEAAKLESAATEVEDAAVESTGWPFGRSVRLDEVETVIEGTPGVVQARGLELHFAGPDAGVQSLAPDPYQPLTWYASSQSTVYRSLNDGLGWEEMCCFPGEMIRAIRPNPDRAGLLGVVTSVDAQPGEGGVPGGSARARVHVSTDCGQTWAKVTDYNYAISDLGWLLRANRTILLLATDRGLYEFELLYGSRGPHLDVPSLVPVEPRNLKAPLYALAVVRGQRGRAQVAVALKSRGGVYLSAGTDLVPESPPPLDQAELDDLFSSPAYEAGHEPLTEGEIGVLRHLAHGLADPEIAEKLQIDEGEVKRDVSGILNKLGMDNRVQAALYAWRKGLVSHPETSRRLVSTVFRRIPALDGQDVRHLAAQQEGQRSYLWAGTMAEGNEAQGCYRLQLGQAEGSWFNAGWEGGSCRALAFDGAWAYAATQWGGVLKLDLSRGAAGAEWRQSTQRDIGVWPSIPMSFLRFRGDQRPDYAPGYAHGDLQPDSERPRVSEDSASRPEETPAPLQPDAEEPGKRRLSEGQGPEGGEPDESRVTREPSVPQEPLVREIYRPYKPLWTLGVGSSGTVMAGGDAGILRRIESGAASGDLYEESSATVVSRFTYRDRITLPYDGLFVSGVHQVGSARDSEDR